MFLGLVVFLVFVSCGTSGKIPTKETQKDSVRVEVRTQTVFVPDTVFVEIPAQVSERSTRDSLSRLENDFAESTARIEADGSLYHDLKTKPQAKAVEVMRVVERKDSIIYQYQDRVVVETVEVERELSWWQRFRLRWFYVFAGVVVLLLGWVFRSFLGALLKRIVGL